MSTTPRPAPNRLTIEQAADRLGIPGEHFEVFERLVDLLRTPAARDAEVARLRSELDDVNEALGKAGITYPLGARGVEDLGAIVQSLREDDQDRD
ncbi:hypothetical protein [Streptomyces seoulensis]|uniref:hypothetical protein n=1 Tax=Streptomyces seoulensis TaxID=73044 RepID=UPI001FCBC48E|nr:hypothetical protein [Streptomyces seoulensis]BDH04886.1 hypothetical protein HEK131_21130 [Streptomyces seoulensis]